MSTENNALNEESKEYVELIIRSAMQTFSDTTVRCPASWTVLQLKERLHDVLSIKPEVSRQRLIYAGHCLDNSHTIHSVLKGRADSCVSGTSDVAQVIHLVYSSKDALFGAMSSQNNTGIRFRSNATNLNSSNNNNNQNNSNINNNISTNSAPSSDELPNTQNSYAFGGSTQYPTNPYDYYAAYQNYINQIMYYQQQYMMHQQQFPMINGFQTFHQQFFGVPPQTRMGVAPTTNIQPQLLGAAGVTPFVAAAGGGFDMNFNAANPVFFAGVNNNNANPQQVANNIQNPPAGIAAAQENANVGNRPDLLDLIYKAIRFILLMMVLYVYSSFERFFMVLLSISLIWFVQRQRERRNRNDQLLLQQNQQDLAREQEQQQVEQRNGNLLDGNNENTTPPGNGPVGEAEVPVAAVITNQSEIIPAPQTVANTERLRAWTVFWSTVSSFFTSLIPENPVPLNS